MHFKTNSEFLYTSMRLQFKNFMDSYRPVSPALIEAVHRTLDLLWDVGNRLVEADETQQAAAEAKHALQEALKKIRMTFRALRQKYNGPEDESFLDTQEDALQRIAMELYDATSVEKFQGLLDQQRAYHDAEYKKLGRYQLATMGTVQQQARRGAYPPKPRGEAAKDWAYYLSQIGGLFSEFENKFVCVRVVPDPEGGEGATKKEKCGKLLLYLASPKVSEDGSSLSSAWVDIELSADQDSVGRATMAMGTSAAKIRMERWGDITGKKGNNDVTGVFDTNVESEVQAAIAEVRNKLMTYKEAIRDYLKGAAEMGGLRGSRLASARGRATVASDAGREELARTLGADQKRRVAASSAEEQKRKAAEAEAEQQRLAAMSPQEREEEERRRNTPPPTFGLQGESFGHWLSRRRTRLSN